MNSVSSIPEFAVVGKVNAGKSSVLATLLEVDDDFLLRISPTPGETTSCQSFPVQFDGQELLRFTDTPGFSRSVDALNEIKELAGSERPTPETLRHFVAKYEETDEFTDERTLLTPLLSGAGLLYVIDPSKPVRDSFIAEMEILRWTGQPRMALLNAKSEETAFLDEWKSTLGSYFNLVRTFNAHHAKFEERTRLIQSLLEIDESHRTAIEKVLNYLNHDWEERRERSAESIISFLEKSLTHRSTMAIEERDLSLEARRERKLEELSEKYFAKIKAYEEKTHKELLKLYKHHLVQLEIEKSQFQEMDLFAEETWEKWGLSRSQLTLAGGAAGAAAGVAVDIGTGGFTHGLGTLFGAIGGAATAFFKGGDLPSLGFDIGGGLKFTSNDGKSLQVGPPKNDNYAWVLLDSALNYYAQILSRTHAVRKKEAQIIELKSYTREFSSAERNLFSKWFLSCLKESPNRSLETEVFTTLVNVLERCEDA